MKTFFSVLSDNKDLKFGAVKKKEGKGKEEGKNVDKIARRIFVTKCGGNVAEE